MLALCGLVKVLSGLKYNTATLLLTLRNSGRLIKSPPS